MENEEVDPTEVEQPEPAAEPEPAPEPAPEPTPEPAPEPVPEPAPAADDDPMAVLESIGDLLDEVQTESVSTAEHLRQLAAVDPRSADVLKNILKGYKKSSERWSGERKAVEAERAEIEAARKRQQEEHAAFQRALADSGFAGIEPSKMVPTELEDVDPASLDAAALLARAKAEAKNEILAELQPELERLRKPMQDFGTRARREQRKAEIRQFASSRNDWGEIKPEMDKIFDANQNLSVEEAYWIAHGQAAAAKSRAESARVRQTDLEALRSAQAAGKGGGTKGTLYIPAKVRASGARSVIDWAEEKRAEGWSEEQIRNAPVEG